MPAAPLTPRVFPAILAVACAALAVLLLTTAASAQHVVRGPTSLSVGRYTYDWYIDARSQDVAIERDGNVLVTWHESQIGGSGNVIAVGAYSPTTLAPAKVPFFRDDVSTSNPSPRVAPSIDGGFLATWIDARPTLGGFILDVPFDRTGASLTDSRYAAPPLDPGRFIGRQALAPLPSANTAVARHERNGFTVGLVDRVGQPFGGYFSALYESFFDGRAEVDVAATPDGGFVVAWQSFDGVPRARAFDGAAIPLTDMFAIGSARHFQALAASPAGDVLAALFVRGSDDPEACQQLWLARFTKNGTPLGAETLVHTTTDSYIAGDLAFDWNGDLYVVWVENVQRLQARGYDTTGTPLGPPVLIASSNGGSVRTARTEDGDFVNVTSGLTASIVSLCTPGTSVCGDGALDPLCERCDDGAANSDVAADACRTTCRPARCGDGTIDTGETCDDGNRDDCDGCSHDCQAEIGLGCGDGVAYPACGETCDDGNATAGDGCATDCRIERVPGGGAPNTDCWIEWSVDNPANLPLLDKRGRFNGIQACTDGDTSCDRDGTVDGGCTFAIKVCANNTDMASDCEPGSRLAAWSLTSPSAAQGSHDPSAAAIRNAFAAVPSTIVGPSSRDVCSNDVLVRVPLKNGPKVGKRKLKSRGELYGGTRDSDGLMLVCRPSA